MRLTLNRMAYISNSRVNELASEVQEKFRNKRYLSADLLFSQTTIQGRNPILDGVGGDAKPKFPRNKEAVDSSTNSPMIQRGPVALRVHHYYMQINLLPWKVAALEENLLMCRSMNVLIPQPRSRLLQLHQA